jgi:hypothetical protein
MINPPTIKQPSWKKGKLATPAVAYSAKLKVAVKRTTAAATNVVANVFFMICYLLGNVFISETQISKNLAFWEFAS